MNKHPNLSQQASKGAFWGLSSNLTVSVISFIGTAILARILSPKDFGLIGMATLVTGVVHLFGNLGLGAALIQKKEVDEEYLSTAFWSSLLVSAGLTLISLIVAPLASMFFNESVIKWIIIFLSVNFIITSSSSVHRTLLYKDIKMKKIALIEVFSRLARVLIIVGCALAGMGFWSIIIGMIAEAAMKTTLFILTARWLPSLKFNKEKFKELFRFGRNIYGSGFLGYFSRNIDFIVTGKILGAAQLGFYKFSYNLPYLVQSYVQDGIGPVAFPVFSKVDDDKERLQRGFLKAVKFISMMTFPVMFGLSFCANDFITVVYGAKWLPAAEPLRLLCFSAALASVHCIVGSVIFAVGRPDIGLKWGLFRMPVTVICVLLFSRWGIIGIAAAMFFVEFLTTFLIYIATRLINAKFKSYIISLLPATLSSLVMAASLYFLNYHLFIIGNIYIRFIFTILAGALVYFLALFVLFKKDFIDSVEFIKLCFKKSDFDQSIKK